MTRGTDWPEAEKHRLRALWLQEPRLSGAEIGRLMGRSKSSIIGQAHRMGLPGRPSPIQHGGPARPVRERAPRRSLPPIAAAALPAPAAPPAPVAAPPPLAAAPRAGGRGCRFPLWSLHEKATHLYCDKPVLRGPDGTATSWCPACARRVFERKAVAA